MSEPKLASLDWAFKKPLCCYYNNTYKELTFEEIIDYLKHNEIDTVVGENLPNKLLISLLGAKITVFRCSGTATKEYRDIEGIDKGLGDQVDAKAIYDMYQSHPEVFYQYTEDDLKFLRAKQLYVLRESIQVTRKQYGQKLDVFKKYGIYDDDIMNRLKSLYKECESQESFLDRQFEDMAYFGKYIALFEDIKGIGAVTVAEVVSEIGNINRFQTQSSFLQYCFGYNGNLKHNRKLKTRFWNSVDSMIKQKNPVYYPLYKNYKEYLEKKHPEKIKVEENGKTKTKYNPAHLTKLARLRVGREIAKLFYNRLKENSKNDKGMPLITNRKPRKLVVSNATVI